MPLLKLHKYKNLPDSPPPPPPPPTDNFFTVWNSFISYTKGLNVSSLKLLIAILCIHFFCFKFNVCLGVF